MSGAEDVKEINIRLSSPPPERQETASPIPPKVKERRRVQFNHNSEVNDVGNQRTALPIKDRSQREHSLSPTVVSFGFGPSPDHSRNNSFSALLTTPESEKQDPFADPVTLSSLTQSPVSKPRPSVLRNNSHSRSYAPADEEAIEDPEDYNEKQFSALAAQERAQRIASLVGSHSAPASRRNSIESEVDGTYNPPATTPAQRIRIDDIPLISMNGGNFDGPGSESEGEDDLPSRDRQRKATSTSEAHKLVRLTQGKLQQTL